MLLIEYVASVTYNVLYNGIQMLHVHAADESLEEELQVNQYFDLCFTSGIFIRSLLQIKISVFLAEKCLFFVYNLSVLY